MQVWNVLHAARWKYRTQKSHQQDVTANERTQQAKKLRTEETVFSCTVAECSFSSTNSGAVQMHKIRCHRNQITRKTASSCSSAGSLSGDERLQQPQKSRTKETNISCSIAGCNFSGSNAIALQMHKMRCHSGKIGRDKQNKADRTSTVGLSDSQSFWYTRHERML